uniref:Uncharacterized protein n=1 Tax=Meloidogyne incognita TaxID=6306 RepID=A0A914M4T8_MELIC
MKFSIYNYNGSKKKQIMFVNIVALSIVVLVLFGQANITGAKNVGLGNHILKEGKVNLAAGSTVVATNEDIEQYKAKFPDACDVDFDSEGNIVLHYKSQGATKDKGCTVDLLTKLENEIVFTAGLSHSTELDKCLIDHNENTLPFAYSLLNEEISQFHNGPIVNMSSKCCNSSCVERTGLELSWWLHQDKKNSNIKYVVSDANPIGVGKMNETYQEMASVLERREYPKVEILSESPRFKIHFPVEKENKSYGEPCIGIEWEEFITKKILPPITWEIDSTSPDPTKNRLLVFHLLPQRASRIREWIGNNKFKIGGNLPQERKCDDLTIKFSKSNYTLLTGSSHDITRPPTANGENNSTTSTPEGNLENMTTTGQVIETVELGTSTAPSSKGSTTAASTITTTTKSSSTIVGIVVIAVILIIIVIGISVYFFVIRKKPDKKVKDVEGGDEAKGDAEEEGDKKEEDGKEKKEDEGDKSKDEEEDGDKSKEDDEEDDKKEVKGSESKTEGETKEEEQTGATSVDTEAKEEGKTNEVESLSPEEKKIEDEIYKV